MISDNRGCAPTEALYTANNPHEDWTTAFPQGCDPQRNVDWRLTTAYFLVRDRREFPLRHHDSLVAAAANLFVALQTDSECSVPEETCRDIAAAVQIHMSSSLEKAILEARLLAQEEPQDIAVHSQYSRSTIETYRLLCFDVEGLRKGIWFAGMFHGTGAPQLDRSLGGALKMLAYNEGADELERAIEVMLDLTGPTLADGLPMEGSIEYAREICTRAKLVQQMLPLRYMARSHGNTVPIECGSPDDINSLIAGEVTGVLRDLRRVNLNRAVLREIKQVRDYVTPAPLTPEMSN